MQLSQKRLLCNNEIYLPSLICSLALPGILCGTCEAGYGVSVLLNHCVSCRNVNVVLIILLSKLYFVPEVSTIIIWVYYKVITDVAAFAGLMIVARKLPTWLYPFTFYLQVRFDMQYYSMLRLDDSY